MSVCHCQAFCTALVLEQHPGVLHISPLVLLGYKRSTSSEPLSLRGITNQVRMDVLVSDLGRFGPLQRGRGGVYGSRRGARLEIEVASP